MPKMTTDQHQTCKHGCSGVGTRGSDVPTAFYTSNVTWKVRFFISVSTCSAWSSRNERMTTYLVYSTVAGKWDKKTQCGNSHRQINLPLYLVWERRFRTSFFSNAFLPASNNFWTKVQLSMKSDAFYQPIFCCF